MLLYLDACLKNMGGNLQRGLVELLLGQASTYG